VRYGGGAEGGSRPRCREHPLGRVRRDGYYGKHKEFIRWECVPGDSQPPHYLSHDQMTADSARATRRQFTDNRARSDREGRVDGRARVDARGGGDDRAGGDGRAGADGHGRFESRGHFEGDGDGGHANWLGDDGFLAGDHDKFILGEKAQLLLEVARCHLSMRGASIALRAAVFERREGRPPEGYEISRDGRLGRDWVGQYSDILAERILPLRWPDTIVLASSEVRLKPTNGRISAGAVGRRYYSLLAAVGYTSGAESGELWALAAFPKHDEFVAREFLLGLGGRPKIVVWNGGRELGNAAERCFPGALVYPSTSYLVDRLREHLRRTWPYDPRRRIYDLLRRSGEELLSDPARWQEFLDVFERYERAAGNGAEHIRAGLASTRCWIERNAQTIELVARSPHEPRDVRLVEDILGTVRRRLGGRQRLMRNLPRLNSLLRLMAIELRGEADLDVWTQILEEHNRARAGKPPPRRLVEGRLLKRP